MGIFGIFRGMARENSQERESGGGQGADSFDSYASSQFDDEDISLPQVLFTWAAILTGIYLLVKHLSKPATSTSTASSPVQRAPSRAANAYEAASARLSSSLPKTRREQLEMKGSELSKEEAFELLQLTEDEENGEPPAPPLPAAAPAPKAAPAARKPPPPSGGSSSSSSRGGLFGRNKEVAREEKFNEGRQSYLERLEQQQREAQEAERERRAAAERDRAAAATAQKAARAEAAAAEAARVEAERQKHAALMAKMDEQAKVKAEKRAAQEELRLQRRAEAEAETNAALCSDFSGVETRIYMKVTDGSMSDKRVLLEEAGITTPLDEVARLIDVVANIPAEQQTIVLNGQVLKVDSTPLAKYAKTAVSELCLMVIRKPPMSAAAPAFPASENFDDIYD